MVDYLPSFLLGPDRLPVYRLIFFDYSQLEEFCILYNKTKPNPFFLLSTFCAFQIFVAFLLVLTNVIQLSPALLRGPLVPH